MSKTTFVVYQSRDEVIVCPEPLEQEMLKEYFEKGERDRDEYDRILPVENILLIRSSVKLD